MINLQFPNSNSHIAMLITIIFFVSIYNWSFLNTKWIIIQIIRRHLITMLYRNTTQHYSLNNRFVWSFVCIYERPILCDNPKPHKFACEKHCTFHFLLHFSLKGIALFTFRWAFHWKAPCFSLLLHFSLKSTMLFTFCCAFHFLLCFSLKSTTLFTVLFTEKHCAFHFRCTFHWKALCFSLKSPVLFTFHCAFHWKALHFSLSLHFSLKSTVVLTFCCTFP